jgi:hypothetical protein
MIRARLKWQQYEVLWLCFFCIAGIILGGLSLAIPHNQHLQPKDGK